MSSTVVDPKKETVAVEAGEANGHHPPSPEVFQADLELEKTNPLARIAGSYAADPNWAEFLQAMEASRRELDETVG